MVQRRRLYEVSFYLFCSELMGIYPLCGSVRKTYITSFFKRNYVYDICSNYIVLYS